MDVRLFGGVEATVEGASVRVGGAAERALLALLALHAGQVVSVDRLIDALWRSGLPTDPGNALQVRVSKLRRALQAAGVPAGLLATRPPGYALDVDPDRVDVHRFARLAADARRSRDTEPDHAEQRYGEALDLWRGEPLAEFPDDWALAERARLEELHLTVLEELTDLRLRAGRHGDALADLERLVAEHPLRERLRVQQMRALYRAGRQADALAVFDDARRRLAEDLGLDPSPELVAVRDAVLRQDPDLAGPAPATAPAATAPAAAAASATRPARAATRAPVPAADRTRAPALPARLTSVVGRGDEVARVAALCAERRLVTLTGPGGAGKTTLATEAARAMAPAYGDDVTLVELAGVEDPAQVPTVVADALGVAGDGAAAADATHRLVAAMADRRALVVLDNCEHLVDASARVTERLLATCPRLHVLATSREPLAVPGEIQLPVRPLPVPPPDAGRADLERNDAVRLFVDRARAADPSFALGESTAPAVADICRRLDGLPLALELAAARVASLSLEQVAQRLSDRFVLLTGGPRTAAARQRTLEATVAWSHDLLTPDEQVVFRRLAVFHGGWTLEAAEAVCAAPPIDRAAVLDLLTGLVARSLVVGGHEHGGRFSMLETLRMYADRRLDEAGETDLAARRHAAWCLDLAENTAPLLHSRGQHAALHRLLDERDNLAAALAWAADHAGEEPDTGLRLVGALGWWWFAGRHDEGRRWVDRMLAAAPGGSAAARAAAHQAASVVWRPGACVVHPSDRCAAAAAESLAAARAAGDEERAAYARVLLAVEAVAGRDPVEAEGMLGDAEATFAAGGDTWGTALAAFVRAEIGFHTHRVPFAVAEELADRATEGFARAGDAWGLSAVFAHHGTALRLAGRIEEAVARYEEAVRLAEDLGLLLTLQWMQAELAYCRLVLGDTEAALALCADAEASTRRLGTGPGRDFATLVRALVDRRRGDLTAARRGFAAAADALAAAGIRWLAAASRTHAGFVAELQGDLAAAEAAHREALELALTAMPAAVPAPLEGLAAVAAAAGDGRRAARLLGAAAATRERTHHPADPIEREDLERAAAAARRLLGEAIFEQAVAEGRELHPATAAA